MALPLCIHAQQVTINGISNTTPPIAVSSMLSCTPVLSINTIEPNECGLTNSGTNLWTGGSVDTYFYEVSATTGAVINSIPKPSSNTPQYDGDLDFDGTNLWYVNEQQGKLYKIDATSGAIVNQMILPNNNVININDPNNWGVAYDNGSVWEIEYIMSPGNSYLYKFDAITFAMQDSFYIPHIILPIKIIDGDLWGAAFDVPYLFEIDKTTGALDDSVQLCVNMCTGITKNSMGFWLTGQIPGNSNRIHLFETFTGLTDNSVKDYQGITLFPQPTTDVLTLKSKRDKILGYKIISLEGKILSSDNSFDSTNEIAIPVSKISAGIYFVTIDTKNGVVIEKFIKQ